MLTMGASITTVIAWAGSPASVVDYSVRFTKPVIVPPAGYAELKVVAAVGLIEEESSKVRIDLTTTFEENTVLGKAQAWVKL
jgi:acyl dehydratase